MLFFFRFLKGLEFFGFFFGVFAYFNFFSKVFLICLLILYIGFDSSVGVVRSSGIGIV